MPSLPLSRRHALAVVAIVLVALALGSRALLRADAPAPVRPAPLRAAAPAPKPKLVVHVVGAVRQPGLYRMPEGTRIADALARAGGATARAELEQVNLAAPLVDGAQVAIPRRGPPGAARAAGSASAGRGPAGPVQLSTATLEQLDSLPGVGPVTAQKILDYRSKHGAFRSVDELDAIPGIGPARIEQLRELVAP